MCEVETDKDIYVSHFEGGGPKSNDKWNFCINPTIKKLITFLRYIFYFNISN